MLANAAGMLDRDLERQSASVAGEGDHGITP
jgi:hypothetical protein